VGNPVLVYAAEQAGWSWTLHPPGGSLATLADASTRAPYFTPDVPGLYVLELTNPLAGSTGAPITLEVYAGTWRGVIVDQDVDGRPVADTACTLCHNGVNAPDPFDEWAQTGHAEIFTDNLNTNSHYGSSCLSCHTIGFDPEVSNGGVDDAPDWDEFQGAGLINHPAPDNWTTMLEQFPESARLSNVQCESCHGPQNSAAHFGGATGEPRVDLSAGVCATCHGEPLRHARFQQWQLSAHANYELAVEEGENGSCSRCHTANGFLAWLPVLLDDDPETDPLDNVEVTWTAEETHPQTCVTCHDPHAPGSSSGSGSNATVRISGDTPPLIAGFQATGVGRGAICMTCHNSRRGLHNDAVWDSLPQADRIRAPHGSVQADVLMGQNAHFVEVGDRGGHSFVDDACVGCHMEATPPPDLLSYNQSGTNHTFFASPQICSECHSPHLQASDVQNGVQNLLDQIESLLEASALELIDGLTDAGNTITFSGLPAPITSADEIQSLELLEARGNLGFVFTLASGTYGPISIGSINVVGAGGNLGQYASAELLKASWNYHLILDDGSLGVHNPFFAYGALVAARDALVATPGAAALAPSKTSQDPLGLLRRSHARDSAERMGGRAATRRGR
jgi:hypothetical protein